MFGCSYWQRDPRRARKDGAHLAAAGFAWVVVPISEERMAFDFDGTAQVITALQLERLAVRVSPWGVGGLFGGEGIQGRGDPVETVLGWLDRAEHLDPDGIYWDEPKGVHGATAISMARTFQPEHVYLNPHVGVAPSDAVLARMASIGIDCYDGDIVRAIDEAEGLASQHGKPIHIWVRGFRIDRAHTAHPGHQIYRLRKLGVNDIAIWGYPSPGVSCLNNDRPRKVWNAVLDGIGAHPATRYAEVAS